MVDYKIFGLYFFVMLWYFCFLVFNLVGVIFITVCLFIFWSIRFYYWVIFFFLRKLIRVNYSNYFIFLYLRIFVCGFFIWMEFWLDVIFLDYIFFYFNLVGIVLCFLVWNIILEKIEFSLRLFLIIRYYIFLDVWRIFFYF